MAITITNYGNFTTYVGTLDEVMGAIKGKPHSSVISIYYDSGSGKHTAILKTVIK